MAFFRYSVHLVPEICIHLTLQKRDELHENLIEDSTKTGRFVLFFWGPFVEGLALSLHFHIVSI